MSLVDLLDFSRKDFTKAIQLALKKSVDIETQWELIRLGDVVDLQNGYAFKSTDYIDSSEVLGFRQANIRPNGYVDLEYKQEFLPNDFISEYENYLLQEGDIVIAMTDMNKELKLLAIPTVVKSSKYKLLLNQRVGRFFNF